MNYSKTIAEDCTSWKNKINDIMEQLPPRRLQMLYTEALQQLHIELEDQIQTNIDKTV